MSTTVKKHLLPHTPRRHRRVGRLGFRASPEELNLIRLGARFKGISESEFILQSVRLLAESILADRRSFVLTPAQWHTFVQALDRPTQVKPKLKKLFNNPSILE